MVRKPLAKPISSRFAKVLQQLLDETEFYTRREWSQFLGVSEPALSQWVNDRTVPRADLLRMAVELLKARGGMPAQKALAALEDIMDEPAGDVSPIGSRFAPDLRSYLRVRSLTEEGRSLRALPVAEQIALLRQGGMGVLRQGSLSAVAIEMEPAMSPAESVAPALAASSEGLGPVWRSPRLVRTSGSHPTPATLEELGDTPRVILTGSAGSGKTAYLSYLRSHFTYWQKSEAISLRAWSVEDLDGWFTARIRTDASLPLVVDGFDEMPMPRRAQAIEVINRAVTEAPSARVLIASRPVSELEHLHDFVSYSIAPLSDVDLVAEVTRSSLASRSPFEVDRFLCHLTERESLKTALRNPLLLQAAWSLFENSAVTPFAEGAIVRECARVLFEGDHRKGFSRVREPWASSQILFALLGEISLRLLRNRKETFDEVSLGSVISKSAWKVPVDKFLDLLVVLGVLRADDQRYGFSHRILRDYFAARYVVESTGGVADYFGSLSKRSDLSGAMRIASSLASDATPLLKTVIADTGSGGTKFALLAEMLAQPIVAQPKVLEESCRALVSWLDDQTSGWKVIESDGISDDEPAKWLICAETSGTRHIETVAGTLRSIHRARSGPACAPLREQLSEARPGFLPRFSEALDVEGKLSVNFGPAGASHRAARVAVENLQLA
jgi:hypothetical protein